jgi:hypothetical protein
VDELVVTAAVDQQVVVEDSASEGAALDDAADDARVVLESGDILGGDNALAEQHMPRLYDARLDQHKNWDVWLADFDDSLDELLLLVHEERSLVKLRFETLGQNL